MDARAKALLSKDVKPKAEPLRAATHIKREFKLPVGLGGTPAAGSRAQPAETVTPSPAAVGEVEVPPVTAAGEAEVPPATAAAPEPASSEALLVQASTKARSSSKFRDGTLAWFDAGAEASAADDEYAEQPGPGARLLRVLRGHPAALLAAAAGLVLLLTLLMLR